MAASLARQSSRLRPWSRVNSEARTSSPSVVKRDGNRSRNRAFTSSGTLGLAAKFQRRTALDATLLTFWPPGPTDRANDHSNSSRGMRMVGVTYKMPLYGELVGSDLGCVV